MISIYANRALSVIKKYNDVFITGNTGFTIDVYEDDNALTYDGTGATPGTYAVTYESTDVVIGAIGEVTGSCAVTDISQVTNLDLENSTVTFTISGTDSSGVPFTRKHRYTYLVIADGTDGESRSIIWKGNASTPPASPAEGWMYHNTAEGTTYMYTGNTWIVISTDGASGTAGDSLNYLGTLASYPLTAQESDIFKYTVDGVVYIYTSGSWGPLIYDGSDGVDGSAGAEGVTFYVTYNDSSVSQSPTAPTGEGNTGGWHYDPTAVTNWMSQKLAFSIGAGVWSDPILMTGLDGVNGTNAIDGQRGSAWYSSEVDVAIDAAETLVTTGDPLVDDPAYADAEAEDTAAWAVAADALYSGWSREIIDGDVLTLSYGTTWSEARLYSTSVGAWVPAGMYVDGSLLVEGSIWTNGVVRSGNYGWGAGVDPEGFILSGEGIPDPAFPSVKYNIVGGSIYGGRIAAADLQSSSLPWADVAGAPETLRGLDSLSADIIEILQKQNDGIIETIADTYDVITGVGTAAELVTSAEPYATWKSSDDLDATMDARLAHIGDVFVKYSTNADATKNYIASYKFIRTVVDSTSPYSTDPDGFTWALVIDQAAQDAYEQALNAYDLADGKRRVFTAEPFGPYNIGDLWARDVSGSNQLWRATTGRLSGFLLGEWLVASTDDTAVTTLATGLGDGTVVIDLTSATIDGTTPLDTFVAEQIDNEVVIFSGTDYTTQLGMKLDDIYIEKTTATGASGQVVDVVNTYKYNGTSWVEIGNNTNITALADLADGKRTVFAGIVVPTGMEERDIWIPEADVVGRYLQGEVYQYIGTSWVTATKYTENLDAFVTTVYDVEVSSLQGQIDNKIEYWFTASTSDPKAAWTTAPVQLQHNGDVWYQTDTNLSYYYDSTTTSWLTIKDQDALDALADASTAQSTADGKVTTFYQIAAPTAEGIGDLWVDSDDSNKLYRWTGASWTSVQDGGITANASAITILDTELTNGTTTWASADSSLEQSLNTTIVGEVATLESKFEYGSTLEVNSTYYQSGFGLVSTLVGGTGTELDPYDSEFWINAEKLKFTNSAQSGQAAPFTIDASGATPQVTFNGVVSFTNVTDTSVVITTANTLVDLDSAANTAIGTAQSTADSKVLPSGVANAINTNTTTINGSKITTGSITAGQIATGTLTANEIAANTITAGNLNVTDLSAITANLGTIQVGTANIGNAAITNAKIGSAAVDTLELAGQSVTIPVSSYTAAGINIYSGLYDGINVQSATIVSTGSPIQIGVSSQLATGSDSSDEYPSVYFRVLRGSTVLFQTGQSSTQSTLLSCSLSDTPPAGTNTYYLQFYGNKNSSQFQPIVSNRSLVLLETKR
jgi:hypothetical protein